MNDPNVAAREPDEGLNLGQAIMARFGELGGVEVDLPSRAHEAALATRNVKDFAETGIEVIDPWQLG